MVVDASGNGSITTIPGLGISVKYPLFGLLCVLFFFRFVAFLMGRRFPENHFSWNIVSLISFAVFFAVVGLLRGNETGFVLKDALGFFYYLSAFIFMPFFEKKEDVFPLIRTLFYSTLLLEAALIGVEFLIASGRVPAVMVGLFLIQFELGFLSPVGDHFFRLMLRSGIFIQIAASVLFTMLISRQELKGVCRWTFFIVGLAGLFILFSRGCWMGFFVSVFLAILLYLKDSNVKGLLVSFMLLVLVFSFFLGVSGASVGSTFADRLFSSFNFTENPSNLVRAWQFTELQEKTFDHPVIGNGYGAYLDSYSKDIVHPFLYELDYVSMAMKFGVGGFLVLCSIFFFILRKECLFLDKIGDQKIKAIATGIFVSQIGLLITGATNPYMNGILGNLVIILGMVSFNVFMNDEGSEHA